MWRPIDSAPKGHPILVKMNGVVQNIIVKFDGDKWILCADKEELEDFKPTEWRPIPGDDSWVDSEEFEIFLFKMLNDITENPYSLQPMRDVKDYIRSKI